MSDPNLDDNKFTLFQLNHATADIVAAVIKLVRERLGPGFGCESPSDGSTANGDFQITIQIAKQQHHAGMMALMESLMEISSSPADTVERAGKGRADVPSSGDAVEAGKTAVPRAPQTAGKQSVQDPVKRTPVATTTDWIQIDADAESEVEAKVPSAREYDTCGNSCLAPVGDVESEFALVAASPVDPDPSEAPQRDRDSLHEAAARGDIKAVKNLLSGGADPYIKDENGRLPIQRTKLPEIWKVFTVPMTYSSSDSLIDAAERGDDVAVRLLLADGADVSMMGKQGFTAIQIAAFKGHVDVVKVLLDYGGPGLLVTRTSQSACGRYTYDKEVGRFTALHLAAAFNHIDIIDTLVEGGAFLEARTVGGDEATPLHIAALYGREDSVKTLIACGASLDAQTGKKETALHVAAAAGKAAICRILVDAMGSLITAKDENGWTPLHVAAKNGDEALCGILLDANPSACNERDADGLTPLHTTISNMNPPQLFGSNETAAENQVNLVALFVSMGADILSRDNAGQTLLSTARERQLVRVECFLNGLLKKKKSVADEDE
ncbi:hypothetical protein HDU96_002982 [Phlyctochytrium bullatum]|nr:hypothetical protein HDU96_002982 [Phlyctochytrium bullatum]